MQNIMKIFDIYISDRKKPQNLSKIFDKHHMSYIGNLEVILSDFVILVQWEKNEKILETSRYAGRH